MGRKKLDCETRKKGKLCGEEECKPCFERSFASHEKSKYLAEGQGSPLLMEKNSNKKYWFECKKCKHSFEARLDSVSRGRFCPFCSNQKICSSDECKTCFEKSFSSSDRAEFWSFEKNKRSPREVFASSHKKFWFECETCEHSFEMRLTDVSKGKFCPFCSNNKLCTSDECFEKSFASSDKVEFWSVEKNKQSPREVFANSHRKYWFECEKKHNFSSVISSVSSGSWCPLCKNKTEAKLLEFLKEQFESPLYQFRTSWCKNPETNSYFPFDFCVSKTIIELDGRQHYEQVSNWKSPEEQQKTDRYKEECAIKNGYSVLRILQKDVWNDKIDCKKLLLEYIKDYESPITKNLWEELPDSAE